MSIKTTTKKETGAVGSKNPTATTRKKKSAVKSDIPKGIQDTFKDREDIKEAFVCREGEDAGQWYFSQKQADKRWRGNYRIIANPNYKG